MTRKTKAELETELETATSQAEAAQVLISNASDWTARTPEADAWRTAARRWLDGYAAALRPEPAEDPEPTEELTPVELVPAPEDE
jgi:hypothetical protein